MSATERHTAIVTNVDDPEKRGRVKVKCQTLVGADKELPTWCEPMSFYTTKLGGWFSIPEVNSEVEIEVVTSDSTDETPGESFLTHPDIRYAAGLFGTTNPVPDELKGTDPKKLGLKTPSGHTLIFEAERVTLANKNGQKVDMTSDGNVTVSVPTGKKVFIKSENGTSKALLTKEEFDSFFDTLYLLHQHLDPVSGSTSPVSPTQVRTDVGTQVLEAE